VILNDIGIGTNKYNIDRSSDLILSNYARIQAELIFGCSPHRNCTILRIIIMNHTIKSDNETNDNVEFYNEGGAGIS